VSLFSSIKLDKDPRDFAVLEPYTDWKVGGSNLDLTKPDFEFSSFEDPRANSDIYDKVAALSFNLIRLIG
jgi:hypothetical protein